MKSKKKDCYEFEGLSPSFGVLETQGHTKSPKRIKRDSM